MLYVVYYIISYHIAWYYIISNHMLSMPTPAKVNSEVNSEV